MWRTLARHFQAPVTFTNVRKPGGANAFATDAPGDYEVTWQITSRGKRAKKRGDQKAMNLQARWIRKFRKAGHRLHNRNDGMAAETKAETLARKALAKRHAEGHDARNDVPEDPWGGLLNPGSPPAEGKLPTYAAARSALLATMRANGWTVAADLKVPHATITKPGKQNEQIRVYVLPQTLKVQWRNALDYGRGQIEWDVSSARASGLDYRHDPMLILRDLGVPPEVSAAPSAGRYVGDVGAAPSSVEGYGVTGPRTPVGKRGSFVQRGTISGKPWLHFLEQSDSPGHYWVSAHKTKSEAMAPYAKSPDAPRESPAAPRERLAASAPPSPEDEARVLRLVEAGRAHSIARTLLSPADARVAVALSSRGLVRLMPERGSWPARYVVTSDGSHALGSFASVDGSFHDDAHDAGIKARASRRPAGNGEVDTGKRAGGQLRMFNPQGALTALGRLTRMIVSERGTLVDLHWPLRSAPLLAYDEAKRLHIVYVGKVERASTASEVAEYKRSHWGAEPQGKVSSGGVAVAPWRSLGVGVSITYTTRKGLDADPVDYVHPWGEGGPKTFAAPRVVVHECRGGCASRCGAAGAVGLSGGSYTVSARGIVG